MGNTNSMGGIGSVGGDYPEKEEICECGHSKKSHCWRPYGSAKKYMRCHKRDCKCYFYTPNPTKEN